MGNAIVGIALQASCSVIFGQKEMVEHSRYRKLLRRRYGGRNENYDYWMAYLKGDEGFQRIL